MAKQFKIVLTVTHILTVSRRKPNFLELRTYIGSTVWIVNECSLIPLSNDPKDFTAINPVSLLTLYFDPFSAVGVPQDRNMLRKDYRFNLALSQQF